MSILRVESGEPPAATPGKSSAVYVVGGIVCVLLIGGVAWYFYNRSKDGKGPSPDTPGDFKSWTSRSGYVGSLEPVDCGPGKEGLLCEDDGAYGVCRRLAGGSPANVVCVKPGPKDPSSDRDCALACSGSGGWRAMFHAKDSAQGGRKSRDGPTFDSDICLCFGEPKTQWDRCVLDKDDRGWTLWSTPTNQKDCDSEGIFAIGGVVKGVDGVTPVETIAVPNSLACQVEVKGRMQTDPLAYAVFDPKSGNCYLKTDDPIQNPFGGCVDVVDRTVPYQLISQESSFDDQSKKTRCPNVKSIPYYGQLPDYYLRAAGVTFPQSSNTPTGADCAAACADMTVVESGAPKYARPAFTWDDGKCVCYDFPGAPLPDKDVWRCAFYTGTRPEAKQLFVRLEDALRPYDDSSKLPPVLGVCEHDGSIPPINMGPDPKACPLGPQDQEVCNKIWDGSDQGHYYCAYSKNHWTTLLGNAMNCSENRPDPEICVDNKAVECQFGGVYRCTTDRGMQGSPCDNVSLSCAAGLQCLHYPQQSGDPDQCTVCQFPAT